MEENKPSPPQPLIQDTPPNQNTPPIEIPKPKFKLRILLAGIVLFLLIIGGASAAYFLVLNKKPQQIACTMEAKICPDGSSVGRTGPKCEFTPCPKTKSETDLTVNWKTYTDTKLKFSIKYPESITLMESIEGNSVEFGKPQEYPWPIVAVYFRGEKGMDPQEVFRNGECGNPCEEKIENIEINNAIGIKTLGPHYPSEDNYYITSRNQNTAVVRLFFSPPVGIDEVFDLSDFKTMTSTFKFTD